MGDSLLASLRDNVVAWEWSAPTDRVITSANLVNVYGTPSLPDVAAGMALVHRDDIDAHHSHVHLAVDRGRGYRSCFRIVRPDTGRVVWIEERAEAIGLEPSAPPMLIGIALNVTSRHRGRRSASRDGLLAALADWCDRTLTNYASHLRADRSDGSSLVEGCWIHWVERKFAALPAIPGASLQQLCTILRDPSN
jgi:hypothetical protein